MKYIPTVSLMVVNVIAKPAEAPQSTVMREQNERIPIEGLKSSIITRQEKGEATPIIDGVQRIEEIPIEGLQGAGPTHQKRIQRSPKTIFMQDGDDHDAPGGY